VSGRRETGYRGLFASARTRREAHERIEEDRMAKTKREAPVRVEHITRTILLLRGQRVILDAELAALYGVTTKRLNEQAKRNAARFPDDFLFRLIAEEAAVLRSQIATSKTPPKDGRGGTRYRPFAFTEHGAIMAATILNSPRAVAMSVYVVRAFVQLRELLASNAELARRLDELEGKLEHHDEAITAILSAIRELMNPPTPKRRGIGFTADLGKTKE
jgi:hypothetical protein